MRRGVQRQMGEIQPVSSNDANAEEAPSRRRSLGTELKRIALGLAIGLSILLTVMLAWAAIFWILFV
jgi:hypothetical protein